MSWPNMNTNTPWSNALKKSCLRPYSARSFMNKEWKTPSIIVHKTLIFICKETEIGKCIKKITPMPYSLSTGAMIKYVILKLTHLVLLKMKLTNGPSPNRSGSGYWPKMWTSCLLIKLKDSAKPNNGFKIFLCDKIRIQMAVTDL